MTQKLLPYGIFSCFGASPVPTDIYQNPVVVGATISQSWAAIETARGTYDWSVIDAEIANAQSHGKQIAISITPGAYSPVWIFSGPGAVQALQIPWFETYTYAACSLQNIPLPWDANFLIYWSEFIAAFGARYNTNATVTMVKMTGICGTTDELLLPNDLAVPAHPGAPNCYSDGRTTQLTSAQWAAVGYTPDKLTAAWSTITQAWARAFSNTVLTTMVGGWSFPAVNNAGQVTATPDYATTAVLVKQSLAIAGNSWLANNAISAIYVMPRPSFVSITVPIGAQAGGPVTNDTLCYMNGYHSPCDPVSMMTTTIGKANASRVAYLEIYQPDLRNSALTALFPTFVGAGNTNLTRGGGSSSGPTTIVGSAAPATAVTRALNAFGFENIWNAPADECGVTLQLFPLNARFVANSIITDRASLALPSPGAQYATFWMNYELFSNSLVIPPNTWMASDQLGQLHQTLFQVYSTTGIMVPKAAVFLYRAPTLRKVYIAVAKTPLVKLLGLTNWQTLYLSVYRYAASDGKPLTIQSLQVASPDPGHTSVGGITAAIAAAQTLRPYGTFVYVNGYDHLATQPITLAPGDYVDIYTDATVLARFTVNLTTAGTGYFSDLYNVYKEILHCPKAINPTNLLLTTELLTLTARRNTDQVGCFVVRGMNDGLTQITHNDVGLDVDIINAYRNSLGTADISIEVAIRSHNNHLIRDANFIDYLYTCDDATILQILTGQSDPAVAFWTATSLEQTGYVRDMSRAAALIDGEGIADYVASLGYYTALAAICEYTHTYPVDILPVVALSVAKPKVMAGVSTYPLVYLDGVKLRDSQVDYANASTSNIVVSITPDVYVTQGQTLSIELLENGTSIPYLFTPTSGTSSITVPYGSVLVFQVNTLAAPVTGYLATSSISLTPVVQSANGLVQTTNAVDGSTIATFPPLAYGQTFLIQNAMFTRCFALDVTSQVAANTPIHMELTTVCSGNTTVVPFIGYQTLAVYLNGRRMIEGIDYNAKPLLDSNGNPALVQLILCNRSVLSLTGSNYLEVVAHTGVELGQTIGYTTNNRLNVANITELWHNRLSLAFANGLLQIDPADLGNEIIPVQPVGNGLPFLLTTIVPSYAAAALANFTSDADRARIATINLFLSKQPPVNDNSTLIIPQSWQVFSPYLTAILADATKSGQVVIYANDPDPVLFRHQFAAYDYLLLNDPTLTPAISKIDQRYVDIYPHYNTIHVPDINAYNIYHRLVAMLLPPDSNTLGDVTNV